MAHRLHTSPGMRSAVAFVFLLSGCVGYIDNVGGPPPEGPSESAPGPDAGAATNPDAGATGVACDLPVTTTQSGKHKPGEPCLTCHTGASAPRFTLGGTLYTGVANTTPVTGATIHVIDATGTDIPLVTALNGNFWTTRTIAFPVKVSASRCPDTKPMLSEVSESGANCNMAGCHAQTFRIFLP